MSVKEPTIINIKQKFRSVFRIVNKGLLIAEDSSLLGDKLLITNKKMKNIALNNKVLIEKF